MLGLEETCLRAMFVLACHAFLRVGEICISWDAFYWEDVIACRVCVHDLSSKFSLGHCLRLSVCFFCLAPLHYVRFKPWTLTYSSTVPIQDTGDSDGCRQLWMDQKVAFERRTLASLKMCGVSRAIQCGQIGEGRAYSMERLQVGGCIRNEMGVEVDGP